jgi:hypothetical protein
MKRPFLALGLILPLLSSGCLFSDDWTEPVIELDEEDYVVVLPFKHPDFRSRWDSPEGRDLMIGVTEILGRNAEFMVRPYQDVIDLYLSEDLDSLGPSDVAALCRADYVLVCDIIKWDPMDEQSVGITKGRARVRARMFKYQDTRPAQDDAELERLERANEARRRAGLPLLEASKSGKWVTDNEVSSSYPDTYLDQYGDVLTTREEAEAGLLRSTSLKVAELFYSHQEIFKSQVGR